MQGAVLVTLKKGEDLPSADPNGYSDPYVKFKLNDKMQKSSIKRFTLNPAWNEKFEWFKVLLSSSSPDCAPDRVSVLVIQRIHVTLTMHYGRAATSMGQRCLAALPNKVNF